MSVCYVVT